MKLTVAFSSLVLLSLSLVTLGLVDLPRDHEHSFFASQGARRLSTLTTTQATALNLANRLAGPGVNVVSASFSGNPSQAGLFDNGTSTIGIRSGVVLSTGDIADVEGPNTVTNRTTSFDTPGFVPLDNLIPGHTTFDAAVLTIEFECPAAIGFSFRYVFASEEYSEYVDSVFNDVFGFFLNGLAPSDNIAIVDGSVVSINTINCGKPYNPADPDPLCQYFVHNDGSYETELDAFTKPLFTGDGSAIVPGNNVITIAIADAGDLLLDSAVFIEEGSIVCEPPPPQCFPEVEDFTLIDADTGIATYEIMDFDDDIVLDYANLPTCAALNIRVNTLDCPNMLVDSVLTEFDDHVFCEEWTPWAVFQDKNNAGVDKGDFGNYDGYAIPLGSHVLKATPFLGPGCTGLAGDAYEVNVDVHFGGWTDCPGAIIGFKLYDAVTDTYVQNINPGDVICPPDKYNIEAIAVPCSSDRLKRIKLVELKLWNTSFRKRGKETEKPYFLWGNGNGDIFPSKKPLADGDYKIRAAPFGNVNGVNTKGFELTVSFTVSCSKRHLRA